MKKKNLAIMVAVIIAVLGMFSSKALALTSAQKADLILASNGKTTSDPAVRTTPASAENYLLKHEKLAESVGLLTRRQKASDKKIAGKADKTYVKNELAKKADSKYVDDQIKIVEDGVDEKINAALADFEKKKVAPMKADIKTAINNSEAAGKKADAAYAEGNTTRLIAIAAILAAIFLSIIGMLFTFKNKPSDADAKVKAKEKADEKAEAEAKARAKAAADAEARARARAADTDAGTT